jgi:alkanesulfonate monooxygenase SsuD/methylene tetrahydromethanopterin reductase-like flavin-dependent oxidoreductase (luciferase family)
VPALQIGLYADGRDLAEGGRPGRDHYPQLIEMAVEAERLGADAIWLTEHHGFPDGYLPQPLILAAAIAARTERVRLGTSVLLAPLRHPAHIAEEAAIVDLVSGGRLELGLGAGYLPQDFDLFGASIDDRFSALDTTFDQVRRLLDEGGVTPGPLQRPFPLWLGYGQAVGARKAGRRGAGLLTVRRSAVAAYLEGLREAGHDPSLARLSGAMDIYVADDPERAYERVRPCYLYQLNSYLRAAGRPAVTEADLGDRLAAGRRKGLLLSALVLTPEEAVAEVLRRIEGLPAEHVYTWATLPGLPEDVAARHRELWLGPVRKALQATARTEGRREWT